VPQLNKRWLNGINISWGRRYTKLNPAKLERQALFNPAGRAGKAGNTLFRVISGVSWAEFESIE